MREDPALIAPVDLRLRARDGLEPPVQPDQPVLIGLRETVGDPRPRLRHVHLHPLVVAGEPVLGHQTLMDHPRPQPDVAAQPRIHHPHQRGDHPRLRAGPRRLPRRQRDPVLLQVLLHGPRVSTALAADLRITHARVVQGAETTNVHPRLRIQDHETGHPFGLVYLAVDEPKGDPLKARTDSTRRDPTYTSGRTRSDT